MKIKRKFFFVFLRNKNEKESYVKVRKKTRDEEGGENQKMKESDYVQMSIYKEVKRMIWKKW